MCAFFAKSSDRLVTGLRRRRRRRKTQRLSNPNLQQLNQGLYLKFCKSRESINLRQG
jgi:hypothetical protein